MKAEDLRIGNWVSVSYASFGFKVKKAALGTIKSVQDYSKLGHDTFIKPIPLTEEWFIDNFSLFESKEYWMFHIPNSDYCLDWDDNTGLYLVYRDSNKYQLELDHIKYVHQLQNLYFSLTGKELEIK